MKHTVKEVKLNNGAKGLVVHVPGVEVVRILVEFRAGFDLGDWKKYELPHVMEHMMFTNKTYPKPRQFSREVEKNGAFSNAYTNSSSLEYDYECAAFEAERIARLIAIQISEPTFPSEELATELGNVAEELNSSLSNPGSANNDSLYSAATLAPGLDERCRQLASITDQDLRAWYHKTHTAANMRFIVAGDIDFDRQVSSHLDVDLKKGQRLDLPQIKTNSVSKPLVNQRDIPQIYYSCFSSYDRSFSYRELVAARIITGVLVSGFSSTLFGKAREKGLVYGLNMAVQNDLYDTGWRLVGMVSPDHAREYFKLALTEIAKAKSGKVSKRQFEATKRLMKGQRARNYQKISNLVDFYDMYFTVGYQPFAEFDRLMAEISLEEATTAFAKLFSQNTWGISFTGNIDKATARELRETLSALW